tara:strand:- start:177 stop:455 length:279 start_codon:yes stop_codon:yes gene_type:complete
VTLTPNFYPVADPLLAGNLENSSHDACSIFVIETIDDFMLGDDLNNDNRKTNGSEIRGFNAFYSLFYEIFHPRRRKSSKKVVIEFGNRQNQS